ncbi:NAD(P)/FAD-dependent oxidoreductase [Erythrobacter donghaensis]|jgi:predicted NAD/FAD-dependent oxidoreductase|uniref:NAD(P)/FAD-dependent oxidoreductase n=3 Tax=Erythrobacter donghaensis TaxID=267135 RepID=UPI00093DE788|nr:FAD-dependent oxidoreductase [Erythrobacter donghaensis]
MDGQADILIIGGGMAGLSAAAAFAGTGALVTVLDKGRGPGGRMAARRVEIGGEQVSFDHGAQYFTARDPAFRAAVAGWEAAGVAVRWPAAGEEAWVGTPGMNACVKHMAADLDVRWNLRAERLCREGAFWRVEAGEAAFRAATVLVAVPAEQAAVLLSEAAPDFAARAAAVVSAPCWAVMAGFAAPLPLTDTVRADTGPVSWAARNSAKPGRSGAETWVIHASPARSRELIDLAKDEAARILLADFFEVTGIAPAVPHHLDAHRWLYAQPEARARLQGGEAPLYASRLRIGIAGDWLHSPRVEGAWLSGHALAQGVLQERLASTS